MTRAVLRSAIDSLVADPMFRNAYWGILVVDPAAGDTLYSRNAGKLFMPASNQKILTGATALAQLGTAYRFSTWFVSSAPIVGGVLTGDLIVVGRGDPSVSDAMMGDAMKPLRAAADSLYALGVREIAGSLVKGGNAFPDTTIGPWGWQDLDTPSGAAVDELFFNNGLARVTVYGGDRVGDSVRVRSAPARTVPTLVADFTTAEPPAPANGAAGGGRGNVGGGGRGGRGGRSGTVRAISDMRGSRPVVHLTGWVAPHDSVVAQVALRDPASAWLQAFAEALADRGIVLRGDIVRTPDAVITDQRRLFTLSSPTLGQILPKFLKPSQNQIGELLLHTLGLERTGVGSADSGRRVVERQIVSWGADTAGLVVRDGSGLSRHDYVTPETIVKILDAMRRREDFKAFYDALPIGGVDGTIANRMRGTPAQGNVRAKTGTVDRSHSLSGYVTTTDGRMLMFSFQANNYTVPNTQVERVQDWIAAQLAGAPFLKP
ncbi:MAG TPA: D-alanyl-D-alanine carboxypeptidase/D-alanyl-D-alanine-endopeptidase [Gemmatimonadaceae bacterium]|nr:D-alanyl-D-alanine carboxypeptidase/D-alanyl-D-alanine-endopeptidase [Gemmatimonadaceae bacterium]